MEWAVLRRRGTLWEDSHTYWNQALTKKQDFSGGIALEVVISAVDLEAADKFYLAFRYKPGGSESWLPEDESAYFYKLILHERGNLPTVASNCAKQWQAVEPLEKPDSRLAALVTPYHNLTNEPDKI